MRLRDLRWLLIIVAIAVGMRVWAPWHQVFGQGRVDFLETDAWYHVRVIEHQVRNFPHHLTHDPYAVPGGMWVPLAPLFDTMVAAAVWVTAGSQASSSYVERVAALAPPVMGTMAVLAVWLLATLAFDRRAGLIAALLAAILPGHFLDRTLVGFVDHHALEALLSISTLAALTWALRAGTGVGSRETGVGSRETGDGSRETGGGRRETGGGSRETGGGSRETGGGRRETGVGSRESGGGRREAGGGSRESGGNAVLGGAVAGVSLGLYLLGWGSGALFVAILAVWTALTPLVARDRDAIGHAARISAIAAAVAWLMVFVFQDPDLYRYNTQVTSLAAWLALSLLVWGVAARGVRVFYLAAALAAMAALVALAMRPGLVHQVRTDLGRFLPDTSRMAVLEARPLFLYSGNWNWLQPWLFFRTGFYLGAIGAVLLAMASVRSRRLDHALIALFSGAMIAATIGQNRFGYYLVPAAAVVIGWLSSRVLDWGGVPQAGDPSPDVRIVVPLQRQVAVMLVAGLAVAPNFVPAALTTARTAGMPQYWRDAMDWLRTSTPPPFATENYYQERYPGLALPRPVYSVMNWWDQGYWIVQRARRVPISNPTQINAGAAGEFYIAGDEPAALEQLERHGSRYVLVDWELPFRDAGGGALGGRFENLVNWAGMPTSTFYQVCYMGVDGDWRAVWLFREPYYRSMAYRLMVLGGAATEPASRPWVVRTQSRVDITGRAFCELTDRRAFPTLVDARRAAETGGGEVVGMDPWHSAFPIPPITQLRQVFEARSPGQGPGEAPMVRIFQVAAP